MSGIKVLLGDEQGGRIQTPDGKTFKLYPLKLADLGRMEQQLGFRMERWGTAEAQEALKQLQNLLFIVWLSVRKNPTANAITQEQFGEFFDIKDAQALGEAMVHIAEISGLHPKAEAAPAPAEPAASSTGPASSSTA